MERGTKSIYLVTLEIQSEQDYQYDVIKDNGKLRRCVGHINPSRFEYASYHDLKQFHWLIIIITDGNDEVNTEEE